MLLVIILAIVSIVAFCSAVSVNPEYVTHQTLQELMFLSSTIALGFCGVISYLRIIAKRLEPQKQKETKELEKTE